MNVRLSVRPTPSWMVSRTPVLCFSSFWRAHQVLVLVEAQGIVALLCPSVKSRVEGTGQSLLFSSRSDGGGRKGGGSQQAFSLSPTLLPTLFRTADSAAWSPEPSAEPSHRSSRAKPPKPASVGSSSQRPGDQVTNTESRALPQDSGSPLDLLLFPPLSKLTLLSLRTEVFT